jgi:hypothetical protein
MEFTVKNIKTFRGMEGIGYNATLYLNDKKFAEVLDDAHGGEVNIECFNKDDYAILSNYVLTLPKWKSGFSEEMYDMTVCLFVENMINKILDAKKLEKAKKKGICFKLNADSKNTFRTINTHDMAIAVNHLNKQFGNNNYQFI